MSDRNLEIEWGVVLFLALLAWPFIFAGGYFVHSHVSRDTIAGQVLNSKSCQDSVTLSYSRDQISGIEALTCSNNFEPIPYKPRKRSRRGS